MTRKNPNGNQLAGPHFNVWLRHFDTPEFGRQVEKLPLRRDMITLLTYVRDSKVVGTQSTGNMPLKAVREVTARFVNPPQLDTTIGERTYRLRSETEVWSLYYLHILAFDVQVNEGVLQILTGGAGTTPTMPEGIEYFHCVQLALDARGLRYQVLDTTGQRREGLQWPLEIPSAATWGPLEFGPTQTENQLQPPTAHLIVWHFTGVCSAAPDGEPQTFLCGWNDDGFVAPLWIGLRGTEQRLCVLLSPTPGRSPRWWVGPRLAPAEPFAIHLALHPGMGPGGLLWRWDDTMPWSSLRGTTAWGAERLAWPQHWHVGYGQYGVDNIPFRGHDLKITSYRQPLQLAR